MISAEYQELLKVLKLRFDNNKYRHKSIDWIKVQERLEKDINKLRSLNEMEITGGEPDVIEFDKGTGEYIFCDCSMETPIGRRNICYDREGLESRKSFKPKDNAIDMASRMGIKLLSEERYRKLQELGDFDTKSSSWIKTPAAVRKLGGALFADFRCRLSLSYSKRCRLHFTERQPRIYHTRLDCRQPCLYVPDSEPQR